MSRILDSGAIDINGSAPSNIQMRGHPTHERRQASQDERNYNITPIKDQNYHSAISRYHNDSRTVSRVDNKTFDRFKN